jgi:triosephosphate isomerase
VEKMRKPLIAGNWKMHKTKGDAGDFVMEFVSVLGYEVDADVVLIPPYPLLHTVEQRLEDTFIKLGAQDVFWKPEGAYTGKVSIPMLADFGVRYCIVGHSETRGRFGVAEPGMTPELSAQFGESDASVNLKVKALLEAGITPIVCVGETKPERGGRATDRVITEQISGGLAGIAGESLPKVAIAYEPVWAIGTGDTCDAEEANRVCRLIRGRIAVLSSPEVAEQVRILYGGSVKPENIKTLMAQVEIDGALVGGASLDARQFAAIVRYKEPPGLGF